MYTIPRLFSRAGLRSAASIRQPKRPSWPSAFAIETLKYPSLDAPRWISRRSIHQDTSFPVVTLATLFFGICGTFYCISNAQPSLLEAPPPDEEFELKETVFLKYAPINPPRSFEQVNDMLHWQENSILVGGSVVRSDQVEVPSNLPSEDALVQALAKDQQGELIWLISGVFDGHGGCETSQALEKYLLHYLMRELKANTPGPIPLSSQEADQAMKRAFLELDRDIMETGAAAVSGPRYLADAMAEVGPAYAGSCALVSYYNEQTHLLKVACTGDSRAVLGRRNDIGEWTAIALSADQTGYNKEEIARLAEEHPGEDEIIRDGRILGLAVSRAFGDSRWKWSRKLQERARERFFGPKVREPLLTPPYLTAEPVVTTIKIEPERGDFVIMGSDGLWDNLTNEQAVNLVGMWLQSHDISREAAPSTATGNLPVLPAPYEVGSRVNRDAKIAYTNASRYDERDAVVVDENAATHLARNALGGGNEDMLTGLATPYPPHTRSLRDDISIQVIFYGNDPNLIENF